MANILSFGAMNLDYVYDVERFVCAGESIAVKARSVHCGGKGLNQALAMARAGAQVRHAGVTGPDGAPLLQALAADGVDTALVRTAEEPTGHAIIQRDAAGRNCILYYGGANRCVQPPDVDRALAAFAPGDWLVLQNEINAPGLLMEKAVRAGLRIVLNPSPVDEALAACPLELVSLFILNEHEAMALGGADNPEAAIAAFRRRLPAADVALTLGSRGALFYPAGADEPLRHGTYEVPVVDTTGAGDTFAGYFVATRAAGLAAAEALRRASVAASIAVSRPGASPSIPRLAEVLASNLPPGGTATA